MTSTLRTGRIPFGDWNYLNKVKSIKHIARSKTSYFNEYFYLVDESSNPITDEDGNPIMLDGYSDVYNIVTIDHYGDGNNQPSSKDAEMSLYSMTNRIVYSVQSVDWGNYTFHSFECSVTNDNEKVAYEPIGLNVRVELIHEDM
jgi:hypothetical protein